MYVAPTEQFAIHPSVICRELSGESRYALPLTAVVVISIAGSIWRSKMTPNHGFIISSQVWSTPNTSTLGSGLPRFATELSKCASMRINVPVTFSGVTGV